MQPQLKSLLVLASLTAALALPASAAEVVTGQINVPSALTTVSNQTLRSSAGTAFIVPQNTDLVLQLSVTAAGVPAVSGSNVVAGFNVSVDGTNFSTHEPITISTFSQGGTNCIGYSKIYATNLTGLKAIRCDYMQTGLATNNTVNAIYYGYYR